MFQRVLIANRGEIACRITSTLKIMGLEAIVFYSEVDQEAPFVKHADEAYAFHKKEINENLQNTYLDQEKIIEMAIKYKIDAIHPGYGLLSENAHFAKRVTENKMIFIGPSANHIDLLGDKIRSKIIAKKAGVPIIKGMTLDISQMDEEEIKKSCRDFSYPLLLKASGGGGGRGMVVVKQENEIFSSLKLASDNAKSAFGNPAIFIEEYIEEPHHVEIQIAGDQKGNIWVLGERECSLQRRHQKLLEEAPSPFISKKLREEMYNSALSLARELGYSSLGTIEFIVDKNQNFYFLEVNTRVQVEHPVTEMIFGIDLIALQIEIAQNKVLEMPCPYMVHSCHFVSLSIPFTERHTQHIHP